eukprot:9486191-Pyramimonas_sp.AAC.1
MRLASRCVGDMITRRPMQLERTEQVAKQVVGRLLACGRRTGQLRPSQDHDALILHAPSALVTVAGT